MCLSLSGYLEGEIEFMPVFQKKQLRFRGVTLAVCLVLRGVTGSVSWELPDYFSFCTVGVPTPPPT